MTKTRYWAGVAAYVVPTFLTGFVWHLVLFADYYDRLQIYRQDIIIPFGLGSMIVQGCILSWLYPRISGNRVWWQEGLRFGTIMGLLFWSLYGLAVAAKHPMTSVTGFLQIETAFAVAQFALAGLAMGFIFRSQPALRVAPT